MERNSGETPPQPELWFAGESRVIALLTGVYGDGSPVAVVADLTDGSLATICAEGESCHRAGDWLILPDDRLYDPTSKHALAFPIDDAAWSRALLEPAPCP